MKCPKCGLTLSDSATSCPICDVSVSDVSQESFPQDTGRFSAIDPSKDSYDFDLQYTLTFKDAGEIRQSIADMDFGLGRDRAEELLHPERTAQKKTEEKKVHVQRTQEEMEEAAQRAALRREQRNRKNGKRVSGERISRTERAKAAALKAAKSRKFKTGEGKKNGKGLVFGSIVAVVVIALIIGTINLFAGMMDGDFTYPTVYAKNNQVYMIYEGKPQLMTENFISAQVLSDSKNNTSSSKKSSDPKKYRVENPVEKKLISVSEDGLYTFFFENVDMNTGMGILRFYQNDSPKSSVVVTDSVYYKIKVSDDGKSVLFLKNTDETGYHGELCYWGIGDKDYISIEQDVCSDNFAFSQDGTKALYIKNFNPIVNTGDLCSRELKKNADNIDVDEKVAFVFGTTKSNNYVYAKNYDTKTGVYDLYVTKNDGKPELQAEKAFLPPVILKMSDAMYAYSNYHDNFQAVSYVDLVSGQINLMAEDVTEIAKVSKDENSLIYKKTYETNKSDYYYVGKTENTSQKVANAVVTVKEDPQHRCQFDASDDFSRIAYIGAYDEQYGKGALYTLSIINGYAGTEKRISDIAYGCDVSADGAVVRFAANFNRDAVTVDLIAYSNSNTVTLSEGVSAGAFTYDKMGEVMVYAKNVQTDPVISGDIESVNSKGKVRDVEKAVSSYGLKNDNTILMIRKEANATEGKLYFCNEKGRKMKLIDEGVTKMILYRYE